MSQMQPPPTPPSKPNANQAVATGAGISLVVIILIVVGVLALACIGILIALLLPAVQQVRQAARSTDGHNRIRQVAIALHTYHDANNRLPPAVTVSDDGTELYSWRTAILPFMEQNHIYNQIDLQKPWDDPANRAVHGSEIAVFQSPLSKNTGGDITHFVAVVGPGTVFDSDPNRRVTFAGIQDGTSRTIMLIEYRDSDIPWYEPRDVSIEKAISIIKNQKGGRGTIVAYADASTEIIPSSINESELRAMFTRNGND